MSRSTSYTRTDLDNDAKYCAKKHGYRFGGWELIIAEPDGITLRISIIQKKNGKPLPGGYPFLHMAI